MTALCATRSLMGYGLPWTGTPGASEEAAKVDKGLYRINEKLSATSPVTDELFTLAYENEEVSSAALSKAYHFCIALPADIEQPELSVDPDGEIAFDWAATGNILSISVGSAGRITYAGKFGNARTSGTIRFFDQIPVSLDDALKQFRKR